MNKGKTMGYAYMNDDQLWPPTLYEIRGEDLDTGLKIVSPVNNPNRVLYVYPEDLWMMADA